MLRIGNNSETGSELTEPESHRDEPGPKSAGVWSGGETRQSSPLQSKFEPLSGRLAEAQGRSGLQECRLG